MDLVGAVRASLVDSESSLPDAVREAMPWQSAEMRAEATAEASAEITGAGPLDALLADADVTDVLVNGAGRVWVDRGAGLELTEVSFPDEDSVRRLAIRLAAASGRRLDPASPFADATLPDGTRVHAAIPPASRSGPTLSLRVLRRRNLSLDSMTAAGSLHPRARQLIEAIVEARLAFVITGGTGSGKTTLLGAILGTVDHQQRMILVEDSPELAPMHPHVVALVTRPANAEGAGEITLRDLVRQSLRMRPDRLIVGEVRGIEVIDLLAALNTGHEGGAATVHANAPTELPARLEALAVGLGRDALHAQVLAALHVVIHVHRGREGRRVSEIAVVSRTPDHHIEVLPAYRFTTSAIEGPGVVLLHELLAARGVQC